MATILITGGTGMIGQAITKALLAKGHSIKVLTRSVTASSDPRISYVTWDITAQTMDDTAITGTDHVVHLAGAGVADKRWTKKRKKEIVDSRVKSGELLCKKIKEIPNRIRSVVSISGVGWYGPDPAIPNPNPFQETDPAHNDFLGQTCMQWESSLEPLTASGIRRVIFRTGIVLSDKGGALQEFIKPLRFGLATIMASGKQVISWIHIDDLVRIFLQGIESDKLVGVYNAVAPYPVSNKKFVLQVARTRKGNAFLPIHVPVFALKIAVGELSIEVLKSATISCKKIHDTGFVFQFPDLKACEELFRKRD